MKRFLAAVLLLTACDAYEPMPETVQVQAIPRAAGTDSYLRLKGRIDWDLIEDNFITNGWWTGSSGGGVWNFSYVHGPYNEGLSCPNAWILICRDQACTQVVYQAASAGGTSVIGTSNLKDPYNIYIRARQRCDYDWQNILLPGALATGTHYVWVGLQCSTGYAWGGATGIWANSYTASQGTNITKDLGGTSGLFYARSAWATRVQGCNAGSYAGVPTGAALGPALRCVMSYPFDTRCQEWGWYSSPPWQ